MITQRLNEFKTRNGIKSADKWAEASGVSKSTIVRALKGDHKDIGVYTLEQMINPWNGSVDELLGIGAYSPEAIEKEELKNEIIEKIEEVKEVIENSDEIPHAPTQEFTEALTAAQELIINEHPVPSKCGVCDALRELISRMDKEISAKNTWLLKLFALSFVFLVLLFVSLVIIGVLSICLINIIK